MDCNQFIPPNKRTVLNIWILNMHNPRHVRYKCTIFREHKILTSKPYAKDNAGNEQF